MTVFDDMHTARDRAISYAEYHRGLLEASRHADLMPTQAVFLLCLLGEKDGVRSDVLAQRMGLGWVMQESGMRRAALALYARDLIIGEPRKRGTRTTYGLTPSGMLVTMQMAGEIHGWVEPLEAAS